MPDYQPIDPPAQAIVVTAARTEQQASETAASVTLVDTDRIDRLGEALVPEILRLLPSTSVSTGGPAGSLTQVRIRGGEANHTLLFVDGIRANDPAAGNEPRFELLNADLVSRIELVRGPQSALWGSEAIGGVVAVDGAAEGKGAKGLVEAGSFGFRRGSMSGQTKAGDVSLALGLGLQEADGIDSFDGDGDRDGYRNAALRGRATWSLRPNLELGLSGFALKGRSQFDGFNPAPPFQHMDTLDSTRNRMAAGRGWIRFGTSESTWAGSLSASLLASRNRNLLDDEELNETRGRRATLEGQIQRRFSTGAVAHDLILAAGHDKERFRAEDEAFGGFTGQSRSRSHDSLTGEWRASIADRVVADVALRHDRFQRFKDAITLRASLLGKVTNRLSLAASYGEGIAQPTSFDLYGFFPGSFVGNPSLKPEHSQGFELSARYSGNSFTVVLTGFRQTLKDEIVGTFDAGTFLSSAENADGKSRRSGLEASVDWSPAAWLRLSANYSYLKATEPSLAGGQLKEVRRPRHSGSLVADGAIGRLSYGVSVAFVGNRTDTDFEQFPAASVRLSAYWLAGLRAEYRLRKGIALFGRLHNAFDEDYQDVVGYRTEGRSAYAGLRVAFGR